jgi:integrase
MPLEIYRRGGVWHCRGTVGPTGRRKLIRRSLQTKNKDIAARQVAEIEKKYWDGHFDGPEAILTFAQAARLYKAAGKHDRFLAAAEAHFGATLVRDITESAVHLMAAELYPGWSGSSLNRVAIMPVMAVINHAAKSKLCPRFTMEKYGVETKIKEPADLQWIERFREHAGPHVGALAFFMYLTGARIGEAIALKWENIDLQGATVIINQSKIGAERLAHLPRPLVLALANLPRVNGRGVFAYANVNDCRHAWEGAVNRAKIKRLSPHSCRHGFATGLLRRGVDVVTVAWLGGWKSAEQVLKTYGHANKNPKLTDLLLGTRTAQEVFAGEENETATIAS